MVNTVITSANGKSQVIDFRDGLVPTLPMHYASIHQQGGKKHSDGQQTYPSVIKIYMCDFSRGTGENSITVTTNIDPTLPYEWLEVCKRNVGSHLSLAGDSVSAMKQNLVAAGNVAKSVHMLLNGLISGVADIIRGKEPRENAIYLIGSTMKTARTALVEQQAQQTEKMLNVSNGLDYSYVQDKVNVYKQGTDGFAPVSRLTVTRQSFRPDGSTAMYPWVFKIINGEAMVSVKNTGATTFQANTMRKSKEAFIRLSDRDMFRMMVRVTHFIDAWEIAYGIPVICNGIQQKTEGWRSRDTAN